MYRRLKLKDYRYSEKGIAKKDGGVRYLGIPETYWRLYLHGLQLYLQVRLSPYVHHLQHGFQKGKGIISAWWQILSEVLRSPDIYEFDLKKYFDSINLEYISTILTSMKIPVPLVELIINWTRTPAINSSDSRHTWKDRYAEIRDYHYHKTGIYRTISVSEHQRWFRYKSFA